MPTGPKVVSNPVTKGSKLPAPKLPSNFRPSPKLPVKPKIVMKATTSLVPPKPTGQIQPIWTKEAPKVAAPEPQPVKRGRGRPRKNPPPQPLTPDPRRNPTFEEAFPPETGPNQIKFAEGEGWKLLDDDEHFIPVIMDRGSFACMWGLARAEAKRKWGSTLSVQGAYKRAIKAFEQAYKESNQ